jgi:hypothetical protein
MRGRVFGLMMSVLLLSSLAFGAAKPANCRLGVIDGEVKAGDSFVRPLGGGLELMVEALRSGWILRILPVAASRPAHDYAEIATPPYHSVSPLLISTDYSFRAQDAVGWNVRRFRYAPDAASFQSLSQAYERYEANPATQQTLAELVAKAPRATLTILDARLVPGTADQAGTASTVATHFSTTPHTIDSPPDGKPSVLGRINWIRFRISLEMPTFVPADGIALHQTGCDADLV